MSRRDTLFLWGFCQLALLASCNKPSTGSPGLEPPRGLTPRNLDGGPSLKGQGTPTGSNPTEQDTGGAAAMGGAGAFGNVTGPSTAGAPARATDAGIPAGGAFFPPASNPAVGAEADGGAGSLNPLATDPLFVGLWVVDQPGHALYEATLYELVTGGELIVHETYLLSSPPYDGYVTGTVEPEQGNVRCALGGSWTSAGNRQLRSSSTCTDGTPRSVLLTFPAGDETQGLTPTVVSVQGETGWAHRDFSWSWRKCSSRANCPPF
jgi:hypothetical protein